MSHFKKVLVSCRNILKKHAAQQKAHMLRFEEKNVFCFFFKNIFEAIIRGIEFFLTQSNIYYAVKHIYVFSREIDIYFEKYGY